MKLTPGLVHSFFLEGDETGIDLDDALATYLWDTLRWSGLKYHGESVVSAASLGATLRGWIAVFRVGPPTLQLTGRWEQTETFGDYAKLVVERDRVTETLDRIAGLADEATRTGKRLLHFGI